MDTMHTGSDGDWLEQALQADAHVHAADYIADDGFTAKLLSRLPAPAALPAWRRPIVVMLWVVAAGAIAALLPELFYTLFRDLVAVMVGQPLTWSHLVAALMLLGATLWSTLVYAMRAE